MRTLLFQRQRNALAQQHFFPSQDAHMEGVRRPRVTLSVREPSPELSNPLRVLSRLPLGQGRSGGGLFFDSLLLLRRSNARRCLFSSFATHRRRGCNSSTRGRSPARRAASSSPKRRLSNPHLFLYDGLFGAAPQDGLSLSREGRAAELSLRASGRRRCVLRRDAVRGGKRRPRAAASAFR